MAQQPIKGQGLSTDYWSQVHSSANIGQRSFSQFRGYWSTRRVPEPFLAIATEIIVTNQ